jgi:hypothetical protein
LDYFVLDRKANLTDLLSVSLVHGGFLISPKFKDLIEQFSLPLHKIYPAKVLDKTQMCDYYWIHIISDLTDCVDFNRSTFFVYYNYSHNLGFVKVSSKEDLLRMKEKLKKENPGKSITIWAEKIFFLPTFVDNFDLFQIGLFDSHYYISQKLKEEISNSTSSGISTIIASNIFNP